MNRVVYDKYTIEAEYELISQSIYPISESINCNLNVIEGCVLSILRKMSKEDSKVEYSDLQHSLRRMNTLQEILSESLERVKYSKDIMENIDLQRKLELGGE